MTANLRNFLGTNRLGANRFGAKRSKVIVVTAITRNTAEQALRWIVAQKPTNQSMREYPTWCFCVENCEPIAGYDYFVAGVNWSTIASNMQRHWAALSIVSWSGERGHHRVKLLSALRPPFRTLVINESGDMFSSPGQFAQHGLRRSREKARDIGHTVKDIALGAAGWVARLAKQRSEYVAKAIRAAWIPLKDRFVGLLIFIAQLHSAPYRWVFACFRGSRKLSFELAALTHFSYDEIVIRRRRWEATEVLRVLNSSSANVIVFRQEGEVASAEPLMDLLRSPGVFAAALQTESTDWRKKMFAKFPFRQLQHGEITATVALYSTVIAVRREVIEHFGVPDVFSAGSAYLLLGWQAASAGLVSYTLGSEQPVVQEVDAALEHAEFVKALLLSPRLRTLSPRHPDLLRGNIATAPQFRLPFRGKPRILVVSPYLPFPLSHGGAVRIFNLCLALCDQIDFVLVSFREATDTIHYGTLSRVFREVHVVDNDERHSDPRVPKQIAEYRNTSMHALIRHLCETLQIDVLQLEYTQMAEYADCGQGRPVLLVEHDVTFTLFQQIARATNSREAERETERWLEFETKALRRAQCVWCMSDHDRALAIDRGTEPSQIAVISNGVDLHRFQPETKTNHQPRVLFIGSFRHLPNLLAYEILRNVVMPEVWKAVPAAELHVIAGSHHEKHARLAGKESLLLAHSKIRLDGFVEDVRAAYRDSNVIAIPLPVSAGTNIKLMEAMACGRAVVSTTVGCVGLHLEDGVDLLIREIKSGFAEAIVQLLQHEDRRNRLALQARRTAEIRFGWDAIANDALASYQGLIGAEPYQSPISFHHQTPTPIQSTR